VFRNQLVLENSGVGVREGLDAVEVLR